MSGSAKAEPAPVDAIDAAIDAEIASEKARTRTSFGQAGIPFVDYPKDNAAERARRLEMKALGSGGKLRSRLMRILSLGSNVDIDLDEKDNTLTLERALLRYAAATTKAAGLALIGAEYVSANENFEVEFTADDAAIVMCGLSELLEVGPELISSITHADMRAAKSGAS